MKKRYSIIIGLTVFLLIGELISQIDKNISLFQANKFNYLDNIWKESDIITAIENDEYVPDSSGCRILIIGDSELYGGGVSHDSIFSVLLDKYLNQREISNYSKITVLDLTRPANNTLRNKLDFLSIYKHYQPNMLIWSYNYEDVYDELDITDEELRYNRFTSLPLPVRQSVNSRGEVKSIAILKKILFGSALLKYVISRLNQEMRYFGIVIPGTQFDRLINKSHQNENPGWIKSKQHLKETIDICAREKIIYIAYMAPELNMLANYHLFKKVGSEIKDFFDDNNVRFVNGFEPFFGKDSDDYAISRYDGHPNAAAHEIIAKHVSKIVVEELTRHN